MKTIDNSRSVVHKSVALAALCGLFLLIPLRGLASTVDVNQFFQYEYSYLPKCTSFDQFGACTSIDPTDPVIDVPQETLTNTSLGQSVRLVPFLDNNAFRGTDESDGSLYAEFTTDVRPGQPLKVKTEVFYQADNQVEPDNNDNLTDVKLRAVNSLFFSDQVETNHPDGKIFRFETIITGTLETTRSYSGANGVLGGLYPSSQQHPGARYYHFVSLASGLGDNINWPDAPRLLVEDPGGEQPAGFLMDEKQVNETFVFNDVLYTGVPTSFFFNYVDELQLEVVGIDAPDSRASMINDLGNTITTYASVFDGAGNLIPDARVRSSLSGIEYAPLQRFANSGGGSQTPVPAPATAFLLAIGLLAIRVRSHKRIRSGC